MGVLIILRPLPGSFSPLSLLALLGMLGFAGRDLASRAAPRTLGTAALGFYGFVALTIAGALYALWERECFVLPDAPTAFLLGAVVLCGAAAYMSLMKAMRTGEVSAVTPFRYTRMLFGVGIGVAVFDETLDLPMLIGCGVVVAAGLFILWRGQRRGMPPPGEI